MRVLTIALRNFGLALTGALLLLLLLAAAPPSVASPTLGAVRSASMREASAAGLRAGAGTLPVPAAYGRNSPRSLTENPHPNPPQAEEGMGRALPEGAGFGRALPEGAGATTALQGGEGIHHPDLVSGTQYSVLNSVLEDVELPVRLIIPAIGVDAGVESVGLTPDGAMDVPSTYWTVGWFGMGVRPGEAGNAVVAGHLDSKTGPAVFWSLGRLQPGDLVYVQTVDGSELTFQVVASETYPYDDAPLERIFGPTAVRGLNLVTCNGVFDRGTQNYDKRLVVYARLVE